MMSGSVEECVSGSKFGRWCVFTRWITDLYLYSPDTAFFLNFELEPSKLSFKLRKAFSSFVELKCLVYLIKIQY